MPERIQKIIAASGLCSRRKAEDLIREGRVKVNGSVASIGESAEVFKDEIRVDNKKLTQPKRIYLAFNKPPDCLTTLDDPKGRKTIFNYLNIRERVIPVGRLDFKTQGLLILTNDGEFANRIMHPRYEVGKEYLVFLDKPLKDKDVDAIKKGIVSEDIKTLPAKIRFASPNRDVVEIKIHEGQNRIIRRMMLHLGYGIKRLIRTKVGLVILGDLPQGKTRSLSKKEILSFTVPAKKKKHN